MPRILVTVATSLDEVDVAMRIWSAANATRRRPGGAQRTERVREKLVKAELLLLAYYGERAAGMALAETFHDDATGPDPTTGHVSMVFVDPAVWGSGVGTRLVRDLQARDWERLSVWTRVDNRRAQRLYLATGFTDSGNRSRLQDGDEIMQLLWHRPS